MPFKRFSNRDPDRNPVSMRSKYKRYCLYSVSRFRIYAQHVGMSGVDRDPDPSSFNALVSASLDSDHIKLRSKKYDHRT